MFESLLLIDRVSIAIGRSTNLISADSNIVIIKGGSRPVLTQMINALEQFFPERGEDKDVDMPSLPKDTLPEIPLQRVNSGVSSIVGAENGERPGGFILVVDGAALLEVGYSLLLHAINLTVMFDSGIR